MEEREDAPVPVPEDESEVAAPEPEREESLTEPSERATAERVLTPLPVSRGQWERGALRGAVGVGLAAALVACLLSLPAFARSVLPHILSPIDSSQFQEIPEGVPIPRLLDWNPVLLETLEFVQGMNLLMRLLLGAFLCGVLLRIAVAVLNPSFRLFHAPHIRNRSLLAAERMMLTLELRALGKASRVFLVVGLPLAVLWALTIRLEERLPGMDASGRPGVVWAIRLALLGAALWIGFHRLGLTGNFARSRLRRRRGQWLQQGLLGIIFGFSCFILLQWLFPVPLAPLLMQYRTLGTFHTGYFWEIARGFFGAVGGIGFAAGTLLCALGRAYLRRRKRLMIFGLTVLGAAVAWGAERPFTPQALAARLDITPNVQRGTARPYDPRGPGSGVPNTQAATEELARRVGLKVTQDVRTRDVLIFDRGIRVTRQRLTTDDGLPSSPESVRAVRGFLEKRHYRSALAWVATRSLYNVACNDFDVTAAMSVCLDDLTRGPHFRRTAAPLREMLFTCAASPENRALLDRFARERDFVTPDRDSIRMMGDLYRRFGAVEEAQKWYRRAEMPRSFMNRVRTERPMYHRGRVTGRLTLNGKPLAGVRVGLLPFRMNGLPHDLEGSLLYARRELAPVYFVPPFVRFDNFRVICASTVTDAKGAFTIEHLIEGEYHLALALPTSLRFTQLQDRPQPIKKIFFSYDYPQVDMGIIPLTTVPRVAKP